MIIAIISIFIISIVITMLRLFAGPTATDRILALDVITNLAVCLLLILSFLYQKWYLIDIVVVYILLSYVGTLAFAKYVRGDL